MSDLLAYATLAFVFGEAVLELGAVYYDYRLARLVGAFAAWILLIAALVIVASHSVATIVQLATQIPFQQLSSLTGDTSALGFLSGNASALTLSALLFGAMFSLHGKFRQLSK